MHAKMGDGSWSIRETSWGRKIMNFLGSLVGKTKCKQRQVLVILWVQS